MNSLPANNRIIRALIDQCDLREDGDQWVASSPTRRDSKPSLRVAVGDDRRILLHDHGGDSTEAIVAALGCKMSDLMPPSVNGHHTNGHANGKQAIEAIYEYRDESGTLLSQQIRGVGKKFYQRRPKPGGGWLNNMDGVRRVLYRLPELLKADRSSTVFICEGEKDVETLRSRGLIATCNPQGAGKWRSEFGESVVDFDCIAILVDADKVGREHGNQVARSLIHAGAKSVKVIELSDLPEHGDVTDWFESGGTLDTLWQEVREAPIFVADGDGEPVAITLPVITSSEFDDGEYSQKFLITRSLVAHQPAIFAGPHKALKTSMAIDAALSLGTGTPFLGVFDAVRCRVGFLSGESGAYVIRETARRIATAKGISLRDADVMWGFQLPMIASDEGLAGLAETIRQHKLDVIFIDPAYLCLLGGDTQGKSPTNLFDVGPLLLGFGSAVLDVGCTPVLLHHFRKNSPAEKFAIPELEEMAMSGFAEWCRQWFLVGRRAAYRSDSGHHELYLSVGGSAGHSGCWAIDVEEGQLDDNFAGRVWSVAVKDASDVKREADERRERQRAKQKADKEAMNTQRLQTALRQCPDGDTSKSLRALAGLNSDNFSRAISSLVADGRAEPCQVTKGGRAYDGFRSIESRSGTSGTAGTNTGTVPPG